MIRRKAGSLAASAAVWLLVMALLLAACGGPPPGVPGGKPTPGSGSQDESYIRTPPPVLLAEYVGTNQKEHSDGDTTGLIDMSNVAKGYIAASCTAPVNARILITKGEEIKPSEQITYPLDNDGTMNYFPLTEGDGLYTFVLYIFAEGTPEKPSYSRFIVAQAEVTLEDDKAPYRVPSVIVDYDADSDCVALSYEITTHCKTDIEVAANIYRWIADNITYDTPKAESLRGAVSSEYVPNPDETLRTKTGICYDYASLAAAMLRANGIPTVLVKGDVLTPQGQSVYHAWNLVWIEGEGWIAVELPNHPGEWTRLDSTFAAAGSTSSSISQFIGDGSNYTDFSWH